MFQLGSNKISGSVARKIYNDTGKNSSLIQLNEFPHTTLVKHCIMPGHNHEQVIKNPRTFKSLKSDYLKLLIEDC